jgi:hypothetical protein
MARRDVTEELRRDVLVDIAKGDERRFGTGGSPLPNPPPPAGEGRNAKRFGWGPAPTPRATTRRRHGLSVYDQARADGDRRRCRVNGALLAHPEAKRQRDDLFPRRRSRPNATAQGGTTVGLNGTAYFAPSQMRSHALRPRSVNSLRLTMR